MSQTPAHVSAEATVSTARAQGGTPALRTLIEGCTDAERAQYVARMTTPEVRILADEVHAEGTESGTRYALVKGLLAALRGA